MQSLSFWTMFECTVISEMVFGGWHNRYRCACGFLGCVPLCLLCQELPAWVIISLGVLIFNVKETVSLQNYRIAACITGNILLDDVKPYLYDILYMNIHSIHVHFYLSLSYNYRINIHLYSMLMTEQNYWPKLTHWYWSNTVFNKFQ